jgi:hypothetical protein
MHDDDDNSTTCTTHYIKNIKDKHTLVDVIFNLATTKIKDEIVNYEIRLWADCRGVGLYVSKQLEYKIRNDLTKNIEDIIETKFIEIVNNHGKNLIIGVIYRPPNRNFATFESIMNTILEKIDRENKLLFNGRF